VRLPKPRRRAPARETPTAASAHLFLQLGVEPPHRAPHEHGGQLPRLRVCCLEAATELRQVVRMARQRLERLFRRLARLRGWAALSCRPAHICRAARARARKRHNPHKLGNIGTSLWSGQRGAGRGAAARRPGAAAASAASLPLLRPASRRGRGRCTTPRTDAKRLSPLDILYQPRAWLSKPRQAARRASRSAVCVWVAAMAALAPRMSCFGVGNAQAGRSPRITPPAPVEALLLPLPGSRPSGGGIEGTGFQSHLFYPRKRACRLRTSG
jgi:hypothetical protein